MELEKHALNALFDFYQPLLTSTKRLFAVALR